MHWVWLSQRENICMFFLQVNTLSHYFIVSFFIVISYSKFSVGLHFIFGKIDNFTTRYEPTRATCPHRFKGPGVSVFWESMMEICLREKQAIFFLFFLPVNRWRCNTWVYDVGARGSLKKSSSFIGHHRANRTL